MIRDANLRDRPRLVEMSQHFLDSTPYGRLLKPAPGSIAQVVDLVFEHGQAWVAEVDGALVGMLGVLVLPHPVTAEDYVDEVAWWVEPEHRGGTVGPRLLATMERWAVAKRLQMCKMVAPAGTDVGVFYERCGYLHLESTYVKVLRRDGQGWVTPKGEHSYERRAPHRRQPTALEIFLSRDRVRRQPGRAKK